MIKYHFRKAESSEISPIWEILQQAIIRRKKDGSNQWQDGYPNPEVVQKDIEKGEGFVLVEGETIIGYSAVLINDEPAYEKIEGNWLTNDDFVVLHRVAIAEKYLGKGLAKMILRHIEDFAVSNLIYSIKADTNFDNIAMIKIFESSGYTYCGEVYFRGSPRKAYEKVLARQNQLEL
ncbi:GNAT family N-acetyltransferase [Flavobacterium sp. GSP27]|uniref:GNAT family N-acetyltransferase n=1 Tax=Flavobacterium bomense TaxID=2497483 RepID=A0A3S0Q8L3_9FLAO|nr:MULTISPECIES: GNAT family N-acetyltransferase [Flavobacterium]RTY64769.1 GNAT family N-acetyltransferase [Flavobacterium sp. LB2P53]RTY81082.1 GNAT family N-acetyltransferase [Flavobacterium sp. ZB4P23]RTY81109.1 GNAT family N-acetyltransferase [Flavobacterium sp. LS1P28]RTZ02653.1 GNAT family N-acetyltransferase [Flavobacterium sp. GSP6]RTZ04649.1 GNAT family N-acetyltransferase [Flavobacterium bomense]